MRHGPSISEVPKQDLSNEHIRALDPDANDTGQQSHLRVCWFIWRLPNSLQPGLLDRLDLFSNCHGRA